MGVHVPIVYSGFWDRPLAFVVHYGEHLFYFHRAFDDSIDDYEPVYHVALLAAASHAVNLPAWGHLDDQIIRSLGDIAVADIEFDPTFRASIDSAILQQLLSILARDAIAE